MLQSALILALGVVVFLKIFQPIETPLENWKRKGPAFK
jgi:hypothetical protein